MLELSLLAAAIVKMAYESLLPDPLQPGTELVDAFFKQHKDRKIERRLRLSIETTTVQLTDALENQTENQFPKLPTNERQAAVDFATNVVMTNVVSREVLLKRLSDPNALQKSLIRASQAKWDSVALSGLAQQMAKRCLHIAAAYIIRLAKSLPEFRNERDWQIYMDLARMQELLRDVINDAILPEHRQGEPEDMSNFDARFRFSVITATRDVEILGLPVPPELRRQPIDVAVVPLTVTPTSEHQLSRSSVDSALAREVGASKEPQSRRGARLLITGQAGSGKTTFVHWLAYRLAKNDLPDQLRLMRGSLPFIVRLRNAFRGEQGPTLDEVVSQSYQISQVPGGWTESRTHAAWLLVDGFDEIPQASQHAAEEWLEQILENYPQTNIIATSRPDSSLDLGWFSGKGFSSYAIDDLSDQSIDRVIEQWFYAVGKTTVMYGQHQLQASRKRLLVDLEENPQLRDLAQTPLLTAMLCAFYANGLTGEPSHHDSLYGSICKVLVDARERQKKVVSSGGVESLGSETKMRLLGSIAASMVKNQRQAISLTTVVRAVQIAKSGSQPKAERSYGKDASAPSNQEAPRDAASLIRTRLERFPALNHLDADAVVNHLAARSCVFHLVAWNEAEFVHRSIMEYLAGVDLMSNQDFGSLYEIASRPGSDAVLYAAMAAGDIRKNTELLAWITRRVESLHQRRRNFPSDCAAETWRDEADRLMRLGLVLLPLGEVERHVSERVLDWLQGILPPTSRAASRTLSALGVSILPFIRVDERASLEVLRFAVSTVGRIGGDEALPTMERLSNHPTASEICDEFVAWWSLFDPIDYVESVLNHINGGAGIIEVSNSVCLPALKHVRDLVHLRVSARLPNNRLRDLPYSSTLRKLDLSSCFTVESLDKASEVFPNLEEMDVSKTHLIDFDSLGEMPRLRTIWAEDCIALQSIAGLGSLHDLRILSLRNSPSLASEAFSDLAFLSRLLTLVLARCRFSADADFLRSMNDLVRLDCRDSTRVTTTAWVQGKTRLRDLRLNIAPGVDLSPIAQLPSLKKLSLAGVVEDTQVRALLNALGLEELELVGVCAESLTGVSNLSQLRGLSVTESEITSLGDLRTLGELRTLNLSGCTQLETLEGLQDCSALRQIRLDGCHSLRNMDALAGLPGLEFLSAMDGVAYIDPVAVLRDRVEQGQVIIDHDPWNPATQETG